MNIPGYGTREETEATFEEIRALFERAYKLTCHMTGSHYDRSVTSDPMLAMARLGGCGTKDYDPMLTPSPEDAKMLEANWLKFWAEHQAKNVKAQENNP